MPRFGHSYELNGQPCRPQEFFHAMEIPNCDDPVFRAYCAACGITPGTIVNASDVRVQMLQRMIDDPTFDPWQDTRDNFLEKDIH